MSKAPRKPSPAAKSRTDAVSLLKADHRRVEELFLQFRKTTNMTTKQQIAKDICRALTIHTRLEEELFYPAFLAATANGEVHHEALVEHQGAQDLMAQIQDVPAEEQYFDAKVIVLAEMIEHHVKKEEQPGGMFALAKKADMDLYSLGEQLLARQQELQSQAAAA